MTPFRCSLTLRLTRNTALSAGTSEGRVEGIVARIKMLVDGPPSPFHELRHVVHGEPLRDHGIADGQRDVARPEEKLLLRQNLESPVACDGKNRNPRLNGHHERPFLERMQKTVRSSCSFRIDQHRPAAPKFVGTLLESLHGAIFVGAVQADRAGGAERPSKKGNLEELLLDYPPERSGKADEQCEDVRKTLVVGGNNV